MNVGGIDSSRIESMMAQLKAAAQKRMITMQQDGLQKAAAGITSLDEVIRICSGDVAE